MAEDRKVIFFFTDQSKLALKFPKQGGKAAVEMMSSVQKALEKDKFVAEVSGHLIIVPFQNVKYIQVSPVPEALPRDIIRMASLSQ